MIFKQKFFEFKNTIEILEDKIIYTFSNREKEIKKSFLYEDIQNDYFINNTHKNIIVFFSIITLIWRIIIFSNNPTNGSIIIVFIVTIIMGIMGFVVYHTNCYFKIKIPTESIKIEILNDEQCETIKNEIYSARNKYLLEEYGEINFNNDPKDELEKFQRLLDRNIIDLNRFKEIEDQINNTTNYKIGPEINVLKKFWNKNN